MFNEYESPVYSEEGTEEFRKCLHNEEYLAGIEYYGAFDGETLIGEIGIRPVQRHICFFCERQLPQKRNRHKNVSTYAQ